MLWALEAADWPGVGPGARSWTTGSCELGADAFANATHNFLEETRELLGTLLPKPAGHKPATFVWRPAVGPIASPLACLLQVDILLTVVIAYGLIYQHYYFFS